MGNGKTLAFFDENRIPVKLKTSLLSCGRPRLPSRITASTNTAPWTSRARCVRWYATAAGGFLKVALHHPAVRQDGADRGVPGEG